MNKVKDAYYILDDDLGGLLGDIFLCRVCKF